MVNLFLHESVPRMMLNLITVGITMELKVLFDCDELLLPGTSSQRQSEVDKLFMHFSCILYSSKTFKKITQN